MDLRYFQASAVEARVKEIMEALDLPLFFENNPRPLDSTNEEVVARTQGPKSNGALPQPANADRYCIRMKSANQEELILLSEYKAPHKLKREYIRAALNDSSGIDVLAVRDKPRLGDNKREQFLFKARQLVAAAATQIYHYMLQGGCKYGCIITGDVIVFLRINDLDTTILNYHVAKPTLEVGEGSSHPTFPYALTTIAQLTSFCLMANDCPRQWKSWSNQSVDKASIWRADYSEIINSTPKPLQKIAEKIDQKLFQEDTAYHGRKGKMNSRSPYLIRKRQPPAGCGKDISTSSGDHDDSDDEPGYNPDEDSPIKLAVEKKSAPH
ncbi:MAG: hypothetical protein LQ337_008657 [Flavoplaca oasis]|nr:MAG: hypothetical protein LQ337_008657 [Flavoplaca oasis]